MNLLPWGGIILLGLGDIFYHCYIMMKIEDFQNDRRSPIVICKLLNQMEIPVAILQILTTFVTFTILPQSIPIAIMNTLILMYFGYLKFIKKRIFDPITIVREMNSVRKAHVILFLLGIVNIIYSLALFIFSALKIKPQTI